MWSRRSATVAKLNVNNSTGEAVLQHTHNGMPQRAVELMDTVNLVELNRVISPTGWPFLWRQPVLINLSKQPKRNDQIQLSHAMYCNYIISTVSQHQENTMWALSVWERACPIANLTRPVVQKQSPFYSKTRVFISISPLRFGAPWIIHAYCLGGESPWGGWGVNQYMLWQREGKPSPLASSFCC